MARQDGLRRLAEALRKDPERLGADVAVAVRSAGDGLRDGARRLAPRDSGRLARSIESTVTVTRDSVTVEVGPTAFYGAMVEAGTARSAPHPFLEPASVPVEKALDRALQKAVDRILR